MKAEQLRKCLSCLGITLRFHAFGSVCVLRSGRSNPLAATFGINVTALQHAEKMDLMAKKQWQKIKQKQESTKSSTQKQDYTEKWKFYSGPGAWTFLSEEMKSAASEPNWTLTIITLQRWVMGRSWVTSGFLCTQSDGVRSDLRRHHSTLCFPSVTLNPASNNLKPPSPPVGLQPPSQSIKRPDSVTSVLECSSLWSLSGVTGLEE